MSKKSTPESTTKEKDDKEKTLKESGPHTIDPARVSEVRISEIPAPEEQEEEEEGEDSPKKVQVHTGETIDELMNNMSGDSPPSDRPKFLASDLPPNAEANDIVFGNLKKFNKNLEEKEAPEDESPDPEGKA